MICLGIHNVWNNVLVVVIVMGRNTMWWWLILSMWKIEQINECRYDQHAAADAEQAGTHSSTQANQNQNRHLHLCYPFIHAGSFNGYAKATVPLAHRGNRRIIKDTARTLRHAP